MHSPFRRWLFRLSALALVPLLFLAALELILRLAGYGYSPGFFKPLRIGSEDFLVQNDQFGLRFFPPEVLRLPPPLRMGAHKPPGTYRIFILGESAAMGDPEPAFGAGRYLEALLRERYPGQQFEIINVAMTAINSHVILQIARDCARQKADLWILYMGNNEMIGPFGAATVFGAQAPPLPVIKTSLALQKTKLGQLLVVLGRKLKAGSSRIRSWGGMQMFVQNRVEPSDPRRNRVYTNFRSNLEDIVNTGLGSGADVILSTVAVNLRDCPPFASSLDRDLAPAEKEELEQSSKQGAELAAQGKTSQAVGLLERAVKLAPGSAELWFRWAECLAQAGRPAIEQFKRACDLDALPFRADSHINAAIAELARSSAGRRLALCDAAAALATNALAGVPGQESFYEHVHLNFDGNYRLAHAWADSLALLLPSSFAEHEQPAWASQQGCERRLGLTDWNRCNVLEEALRRMQQPPLSTQSANSSRVKALAAWQSQMRGHLDSAAASQARQLYLEALQRAPEDFRLLANFADFLQAVGDSSQAASVWQRVCDLIPQDHVAYYELGRLALLHGAPQQAISWLSQCLAIRPNFNNAWLELGNVQAAQGNVDLALKNYARALELQPQDAQAWFCSGLILAKSGQRDKAIGRYEQAVRFNPNLWQARFELGGQLGLAGKIPEAREQLEQAVRLNPAFPMAHLNLGLALLKQGQLEQARHEFEETLRLDPANRLAPVCLQQLTQAQRQPP